MYPAAYLTGAGLGMVVTPHLLLRMMLSDVDYDPAIVRTCGLFVLGLAMFVIETVRHRLVVLYRPIIAIRVLFCAGYVVLYAQTGNPFFVTTLGVVGAGVIASSIASRARAPSRVARAVRADLDIDANGKRFSALAWGDGPVVLLLHGFPDTAHTWDEVGPAIARAGYRVIAPFLRGYPPSELPDHDIDARTLGEDIIALAAAVSAEPVRVVGHDWGAEAIHNAVALAPERFERIVTIAIPHRATVALTPSLVWKLRHFFTLKLPGAVRRFAADDFAMIEVLWKRWSPTWRYTAADLEAVKNHFAIPGALDAALGYYRAAEIRTPAFLRTPVEVPALAIAGADDPSGSRAIYDGARRQFRAGYEVIEIPGGHFCHRESPTACADAIVGFFGERTDVGGHPAGASSRIVPVSNTM
jgi:pimeloyl-ACP methyl ester carboxylesterase